MDRIKKTERQQHGLAPLFDENSRVLVLGSFPSPKSRAAGMYYSHPRNRFWKVLAAVFGETEPETPEERRAFALKTGIALYDVIECCDIEGAKDSSVKNAVPADLSVFSGCRIKRVFVTGKLAGKLYAKYFGDGAVILPSPSPANCSVPFDKMVESYGCIRDCLLSGD